GFYCWGLKPPENVTGLRLLPGVYSGYTLRPGLTALFRFAYSESKGPGQAALAVDQTRCWFGTTRTAYQYLCLSFPPAYKDGVFRVHRGETVTGKLLISQARPDIWNPVFKEEEYASEEKLEFLPPRYPYSLYLDYFSTFARQPSLWVPLGKGMGLYHVGYYGHLTRVKRGGPYGYACQGRPLRYRQLAEWLEKKRPGLSHFQENTRQLEIAWGNGTNAMVAYALLLLGKPWSVSRGREIVQAILRFGFLISRGPLSGAWWGAYNVDRKRFQDHYGGQQLFLPDQGLVNHFLARAALDGFVPVSLVQEAIERNVNFLERLERKFGWFPNAVSSDGQIGYSREGVLYRQPVAPGIALVAQSLVMLARLSGEKKFLRTAERIIQQHLLPLFARNDFGCLEYDHAGHDSSGACLLLVSLAEYLNCPGARLREEISYWQERIFWHLMSFRHEYDFFPYLHSFNAVGWGGVSVNKFGFLHGFTPGSSQGEYALHLRYDYGYGLWKTGETNPVLPAYPALVNYLNHLTYHQFINPKLKKGFGGLTEHVAMRTYVQDTTHILHSTPLPMILLLRRSREEKRFWEPLGGYEARS
ncbi:MAG TPA: hypothetical protein PKW42_06960, partial [bacterium]|nr:hypothetical protein [bacterium]